MGRIIVGWIADFPVIVAGTLGAKPVAVVHRDVVVACSETACQASVRRRMRVRVAQARCPQLRVVERDLAAEMRAFEPAVRHIEGTVMPRLEVIRPGLIAAPARGPSRYWGGEQQLIHRLTAALAELDLPARAGIADTVFTAALAARTGQIVPAGGDAAWLAPFPVGVLGETRLAELLQRLGIRTVGAYAALPEHQVLARFGADGIGAHRTARGRHDRPLSVRANTGEHTVAYAFETAAYLLDPVVFAAKACAEQLHERLAAASVVCARLEASVDLADGRTLSRTFRHEGRLSALAVAERVRGVLQAWADAGLLDTEGEQGIVRLVLRPEELTAATGRQSALFGERHTPEEIERAAARVQAMLGHQAVVRVELGGGRGPADRVRLIPFGDVDAGPRPAGGPWPGRLPAPHPASVFPRWLPARLTDTGGQPVTVAGRLALSAPPARVAVEGYGEAAVDGWAGPWPVLERWWDRDQARRIARMQIAAADGRAWLLVIEHGRWWAEAHYG
ncbi:DNA polymerase Y family protein [Streptomyces sp. PSKA30]|uniref:DNA polymerase Y family protein n=1 Tax=Streptomyces sp. PSKA30 TaxID=2874597 RepID=UPI001CD09D74|nr:DNA polymerase Y family protein [Streptomyces sp. PSKA30]MBZ9644607.1 DNA polymerase Y family protein [Streptomyces sp. PSKA30]